MHWLRWIFVGQVMLLPVVTVLAQASLPPESEIQASHAPAVADMAMAQARAREILSRILIQGASIGPAAKLPEVSTLPKPAAPAVDLADIAERYKTLGHSVLQANQPPDLLVMVSLSLPKASLQRIVDHAERAGATLVFRGLKDDSMVRMGEAIQSLIGSHQVSAVIHPPAFQQFGVTQVPTMVIARREAGQVLNDGCSKAESFVKVAGDVSLDYALEYIERTSPAWKDAASGFRRRIVGDLP